MRKGEVKFSREEPLFPAGLKKTGIDEILSGISRLRILFYKLLNYLSTMKKVPL